MTLKCIAGIETPDSGKIILDGKVLFDSENNINLPTQERNIGLLFQNYALFPNMTLKENILIGLRNKSDMRLVDNFIDKFKLKGLENNYPNELSGGQQQRAALARMLINEPDIIMLDEPFSALDQHLRWNMEKEISDIIEEYEGSILYVSHNKNEVYRLCEYILVMEDGCIVEKNDKFNIFYNPTTLSSAILIGIKNISKITLNNSYINALDWNYKFESSLLDFDNSLSYNYIAINESDIEIVGKNKIDSKFLVVNIIDEIEHKLLMIEHSNNILYVKISKDDDYNVGDILSLDFPIDRLKLLI